MEINVLNRTWQLFKLTPPVFQGDIQKGLKLLEELFFSSQEICDQDCLLHLSVG